MNQKEWMEEFKKLGALWVHDGNPRRPHALLTSGKHSDGFCNASKIIAATSTLAAAVHQMVHDNKLSDIAIDRVVGSANGGNTIAHTFAQDLPCKRMAFTEKKEEIWFVTASGSEIEPGAPVLKVAGTGNRFDLVPFEKLVREEEREVTPDGWNFPKSVAMLAYKKKETMEMQRFDIREGEKILIVEDVLTTGKTTRESIASLEKLGAVIVSPICTIVNRSGKNELDGRPIISLIDLDLSVWDPKDCPLCKKGSQAVRPKKNWAELHAEY